MLAFAGIPVPQLSLSRQASANTFMPRPKPKPDIFALGPTTAPFIPGGISLPGAGEPVVADTLGARHAHVSVGGHGSRRRSSAGHASTATQPDAAAHRSRQHSELPTPSDLALSSHKSPLRSQLSGRPADTGPLPRPPPAWNDNVRTPGLFDPSLPKVSRYPRREKDSDGVKQVTSQRQPSPPPGPSAYELPVSPPLPVYPASPPRQRRGAASAKQRYRRRRSPVLRPDVDPRWAHVTSQYSQRPSVPGSRGRSKPGSLASRKQPAEDARAISSAVSEDVMALPLSPLGVAPASAAARPPAAAEAQPPLPPPLHRSAAPPQTASPPPPGEILVVHPEVLAPAATAAGPLALHTTHLGGRRRLLFFTTPLQGSYEWRDDAGAEPQPVAMSASTAAGLAHAARGADDDSQDHGGNAEALPDDQLLVPPRRSMLKERAEALPTETPPSSSHAAAPASAQAPPLLRVTDAAELLGGAVASSSDLEALLRRLDTVQRARTAAQLVLEAHQSVALSALAAARGPEGRGGSTSVSRALRIAAHELIANERIARHISAHHQTETSAVAFQSGQRSGAGDLPVESEGLRVAGAGLARDSRASGGSASAIAAGGAPSSTGLSLFNHGANGACDELESLPMGVIMAVADDEVFADASTPAQEPASGGAKALAAPTLHTGLSSAHASNGGAEGGTSSSSRARGPQQQLMIQRRGPLHAAAGGLPSQRTLQAHLENEISPPSCRRQLQRCFPQAFPAPSPLYARRRPGFSAATLQEATAHADAVHRRARINDVSLTAAGIDPVRLVSDAAAAIADAVVVEVAHELADAVDGVAEALLEAV